MISNRIRHWAHGLLSAMIGGAATALSSAAGIGTANALGIPDMLHVQHIPNLTWPQIGSIALGGGFWTMIAYLKKSPLPPESTGMTGMWSISKPSETTTNPPSETKGETKGSGPAAS